MRKSTIFISATLTTFALVMLYSVVAAYRGVVNTAATLQPTAQPTEVAVDPTIDATPVPTDVTPEQAAQLAAQVLGRSDLLSAESSSLNGVGAYKITFISGDIVYVSTAGQILSIQMKPQVITVQADTSTTRVRNKNKNNNTTANESHESGQHEDN